MHFKENVAEKTGKMGKSKRIDVNPLSHHL